jgi:hypothetical protein
VTYLIEYLGEFEFIFETILDYESRDQMGSFDAKKPPSKISCLGTFKSGVVCEYTLVPFQFVSTFSLSHKEPKAGVKQPPPPPRVTTNCLLVEPMWYMVRVSMIEGDKKHFLYRKSNHVPCGETRRSSPTSYTIPHMSTSPALRVK